MIVYRYFSRPSSYQRRIVHEWHTLAHHACAPCRWQDNPLFREMNHIDLGTQSAVVKHLRLVVHIAAVQV